MAALAAQNVPDYNKYLHTNSATGLIEYVEVTATNYALAWTGTPVTITHNLGYYPLVQIMETSSGDIVCADIDHTSINAFTVDFDPITTLPYNFTVIYT